MRSLRTPALLSTLLLASVLLTACPSRTSINKINADPDRYRNKEVAVAGTVRESYGAAVVGGAYELDDGTGRIWVIADRSGGVPSRGAQIGVKGRVYNGLTFGGRNFGTVIRESDRRSR